ncbi:MAG: putative repeat protein (TIGR01451 family) [Mariniblastus sp.]|jgi:uncharacterized repeat protein (TIGR01451 family)
MKQFIASALICLITATTLSLAAGSAQAQINHELIRGDMPPGMAADFYRMSNPKLAGHVQPVRVFCPDATRIEVAANSGYVQINSSQVSVGMIAGPVYRFKVTDIPLHDGEALYPSVEILNRLHPPQGLANNFPVQVVISKDDLKQALAGRLVTRVIYLENPETALPHRHVENDQPSFDVGAAGDPLRAAEKLGRPMAILRIGSRVPMDSDSRNAFNFNAPAANILPDPEAIQRDPNWEAQNSQASKQNFDPNAGRDEYVYDGNDRGAKVQVDRSWNYQGLNTEDTVGHFDTLDGQRIVTPSNRVAIYAPRFGAVRRVNGVFNARKKTQLVALEEQTPTAHAKGKDVSSTSKQHLALKRFEATKRASGFVDRTRGVVADAVVHLFGSKSNYSPYENLTLIRTGKMANSETARLRLGMQSAGVWKSDLGLRVFAKGISPIIVNDITALQELVHVETEEGSAVLRVTKIASKIAAKTGELVEFTIRFDNLSSKQIGNVTIIDNLTRRLEYVPNSATSTLKADFVNQRNDGGSLMLRWEILEPLDPQQGGVVRFQCRVR